MAVDPTRWATTREAEHAVLGLTEVRPDLTLATHFSGGGVVVTSRRGAAGVHVHRPGGIPSTALDEEDAALRALHRDQSGGRLFAFPGAAEVTGPMTVAALLAATAIDAVVVLGQVPPPAPDTVLDPQGFLRPHLEQGRVMLAARPAAGGILVPFEQATPTPCCAGH